MGEHCDLWMRQAEQAAASQKTQSEFVPTKSSTPLEIYVTVHLKVRCHGPMHRMSHCNRDY